MKGDCRAFHRESLSKLTTGNVHRRNDQTCFKKGTLKWPLYFLFLVS